MEFIKVVKDQEKIKSLFNGYETEKIETEESKKAEVTENDIKKEKNTNKENAKGVEKTNNTNSVELDEILDKKEDNGKQEKSNKENDLKLVKFDEFIKGKEDKKDIKIDEESKIVAIADKNVNGFIKYEYINEETKKVKATEIWDKSSYKTYYNEYKTAGFADGTTKFDAEALKNLDPLLLKYLERTKGNHLRQPIIKKETK